jgi:glycosyltransferase involved in cell wall biosynthesis
MRFHVIGLPHTHATAAFSACAYTNKVIGFCRMMKALGHTVILYAGEQNEAPCDELVTCISEDERNAAVGGGFYTSTPFRAELPHWRTFNGNVIEGLRKRAEPQDFICLIAGHAQKPIADAFPQMIAVEFGVGYGGVFSRYRVFESHAWMHMHYGHAAGRAGRDVDADGALMEDAVIPGYLDPDEFRLRAGRGTHFVFAGRLIDRKGAKIAAETCERLGVELLLAGSGEWTGYGKHVGVLGRKELGHLMAEARAVFVPTLYVEPFGNVAIEAMACGTPVLTTDFGAFTETVRDGVTGFRCHTLAEFCEAAQRVAELDPHTIRQHVVDNYSLEVIGRKYEAYFERLSLLWTGGWYAGAPAFPAKAA